MTTATLAGLPSTFTTGEAIGAGLHPRDLYGLRDDGTIVELSRGVYRKAGAPVPTYPDLLAVARRAPRAIVCLTSALAVHDLTDEIPHEVHIAVPRHSRPPAISYPPVVVHRFEDSTFEHGVEAVEVAPGESVRVYSAARSVVDAVRLRRQVGELSALGSLRRYLQRPGSRPQEVLDFARMLGVAGPVRAAMDAVLA